MTTFLLAKHVHSSGVHSKLCPAWSQPQHWLHLSFTAQGFFVLHGANPNIGSTCLSQLRGSLSCMEPTPTLAPLVFHSSGVLCPAWSQPQHWLHLSFTAQGFFVGHISLYHLCVDPVLTTCHTLPPSIMRCSHMAHEPTKHRLHLSLVTHLKLSLCKLDISSVYHIDGFQMPNKGLNSGGQACD